MKEEMKRSEERIYLEIDKIDEMPSFSYKLLEKIQ